jgi:hypothetical protein
MCEGMEVQCSYDFMSIFFFFFFFKVGLGFGLRTSFLKSRCSAAQLTHPVHFDLVILEMGS